jgi:hypothetical protein
MKKILVVTCSKTDGKQSQLVQSLSEMKDDVTLVINANNTSGLSKAYNKQLTPDNLIKHDIVLFIHDDVYIDDLKLKGKLYTAINQLKYDIIGLAGASKIKIRKPCLWHRMSEPKDWSGAVSHPLDNHSRLAVTTFGPWPSRCLVLDGLFLAVNLRRVLEAGWKFNEAFKYHHYDIAACLDANKLKLTLGTYPIWVTHNSPGLRDINDKSFQQSQDIFYNSYEQ